MPGIDGSWLTRLITTPLGLSLAGALAALIVVGAVMVWRRAPGRWLLPFAALLLAAVAATALVDRLTHAERAAERSALLARAAALERSALQPGSALACLDAGAGETVENACEKAVFASPQAAAAAVAYMRARLQLLHDAAALAGDAQITAALAASRRAIALDRYGVAAQVLARRDGCTAVQCPAFALIGDSTALKANLKAQAFAHYVSRYAAAWSAAAEKAPAQAQTPAQMPLARATDEPLKEPPSAPSKVKPGEQWDFPSAASIPPVSIMNAEPPLPKTADAPAPAAPAPAAVAKPPLPHKRPPSAIKPPLSLSGAGN